MRPLFKAIRPQTLLAEIVCSRVHLTCHCITNEYEGYADPFTTAIADRAFTNAKAANDVDGMTSALVYRALERNTGSVGLKSNACTTFTPTNQELVGLEQHQDPASEGAAALNKAITLDLATRIASIGGDPQIALQSGVFLSV